MRERLGRWLTILALAGSPASAFAQTLEGLLSPGPLIKGHAKYEDNCRTCHVPFDRPAQTRLCAECHKEIGADLRNRTRFHGRLKDATCRTCHTEHEGRDASGTKLDRNKFDHDATNYPLKGGHRRIASRCAACHQPGVKYRDAPQECVACHRKGDVHKGKLGEKCAECHSVETWKVPKFDHDKTRFKLEGAHVKTTCRECHQDQTYRDTPRECIACHKKDDDKNGHRGHFGTKCADCHGTRDWKDSLFDHDRDAHYPLKGKHFEAKCIACHKAPLYTEKLPSRCVSCHRKDDQERGHRGGLGEKCESCHNERGWKDAAFDHDRDTDYPLTGKHRQARCESCHQSGVTARDGKARLKAPRECIGCHRKDDNEKGHKGKFGEKCETCHATRAWKDVTFRHDRDTKYPLSGKHARTSCVSCHTGQLYKDKAPTECIACHRKDDNEKGHKGSLGTQCDSCHNVEGWKVRAFDHNKSRFPLLGSHARVECRKCHESTAFRDAPRDCYGCHQKDDVHKRRLGVDCETCHNARSWKSWDFDHGRTTFPLTGAHRRVQCYACHSAPMEKRTQPASARACASCHTKDDVHKGVFGARCERCHSDSDWKLILQR